MNTNLLGVASIALLMLVCSVFQTPSQSGSSLVFTHITVVDVKTGELEQDMIVVVKGGRITDIGKTTAVSEGAQRFEGTGKYVLCADVSSVGPNPSHSKMR